MACILAVNTKICAINVACQHILVLIFISKITVVYES